jgi:hypothetical protein
LFFDLVNTTIVRLFSSQEHIPISLGGSREDLSTTVKLDNTHKNTNAGQKSTLRLYHAVG